MIEIWKTVSAPGYEVEVSDFGRVRTLDYLAPSMRAGQPSQLRAGRLLKPDMFGPYPRIVIKRNGKTYRIRVHRLVAKVFVEGWFDEATVDHIDGDRTNNHATNLRWLTRAENTREQNAAGRGVPKGQSHPGAKLADADVPALFAMREAGMTLNAIGEQFGVSGSLVHKITSGKRRVHTAPNAR